MPVQSGIAHSIDVADGAEGALRPSDCQAWATLLLATAMS
jgi:hypothetical protein